MHIGEVAQRSGVAAPTIRYYEANKLVTRAARSPGGYRLYSDRVLDELAFIRRAQRIGLTLDEVREILNVGARARSPAHASPPSALRTWPRSSGA